MAALNLESGAALLAARQVTYYGHLILFQYSFLLCLFMLVAHLSLHGCLSFQNFTEQCEHRLLIMYLEISRLDLWRHMLILPCMLITMSDIWTLLMSINQKHCEVGHEKNQFNVLVLLLCSLSKMLLRSTVILICLVVITKVLHIKHSCQGLKAAAVRYLGLKSVTQLFGPL